MWQTLQTPPDSATTIRIVIVACRQLDSDALSAICQAQPDIRVLCATSNVKMASIVCHHRRPDAILLDAGFIGHDGIQGMAALRDAIGDIPIMLLDQEVNDARLSAIIDTPRVGYYTRSAAFAEVADGLRRLIRGERAFCRDAADRVQQTSNGWHVRHLPATSPFAVLTPREIEVLRLIALGRTIKDCAVELNLSPSTVDNHKTRLMKKLGIHRSLDLARLAIREGLVEV